MICLHQSSQGPTPQLAPPGPCRLQRGGDVPTGTISSWVENRVPAPDTQPWRFLIGLFEFSKDSLNSGFIQQVLNFSIILLTLCHLALILGPTWTRWVPGQAKLFSTFFNLMVSKHQTDIPLEGWSWRRTPMATAASSLLLSNSTLAPNLYPLLHKIRTLPLTGWFPPGWSFVSIWV